MSQFTTQESITQYMNPYGSGRKLPFLRRNIAKAISRGYPAKRRRTTSAAASSQRALGNVVRSYRYANPMQIQPSNSRTQTFWRAISFTVDLNQRLGFIEGLFSSRNINFGYTLGGVSVWLGGVYVTLVAMPNVSEFQALFDYYQINAVKIQMFYNQNVSDGATSQAGFLTSMPLIHIANDFDDCQESMTQGTMLERVGLRTVQFDAMNHNGIRHYVKPKPSQTVAQLNPTTGAPTSANASIAFGSTWIDCAQSNVIHYGTKMYLNGQDIDDDFVMGKITFIFDIELKFKGYR